MEREARLFDYQKDLEVKRLEREAQIASYQADQEARYAQIRADQVKREADMKAEMELRDKEFRASASTGAYSYSVTRSPYYSRYMPSVHYSYADAWTPSYYRNYGSPMRYTSPTRGASLAKPQEDKA